MSRTFDILNRLSVVLIGSLTPSGQTIVRKISEDGTEATRVADSQGRSTSADLNVDRLIKFSIQGTPPRGEAGNLEPCKILIERLNQDGEHWGQPENRNGEEDGIDCIAKDGQHHLRMQVTRVAGQHIWHKLGSSKSVTGDSSIEHMTSDLCKAIEKKENLSYGQRSRIVLVLDAIDSPGHTYPLVVKSFRQKYCFEIQKLNFEAIWVVGPTSEMTTQLDIEE